MKSVNFRESSERHEAVLRQLNEERAAALTRISRTLESIIEQLRTLHDRIRTASGNVSSADAAEYERVRTRAMQYRWYLEVQREALGLYHHGFLDRFYAVPGPLIIANGKPPRTNPEPT